MIDEQKENIIINEPAAGNTPTKQQHHVRSLGVLQLIAISFFTVSGGMLFIYLSLEGNI